jgi:hypothetical protein
LNKFCEDCPHCNVPDLIKEKFNEEIEDMFFNCPLNDNKVIYCFTKEYEIKWDLFINYLLKENKITPKQLRKEEKKEGKRERRKRSN